MQRVAQHVSDRFNEARDHAGDLLRHETVRAPGTNAVSGFRLIWSKPEPQRALVILLRPDAGAIEWQLGSAATEVAKEGRVDVYEFSPGRLDELIFALFDQETWQRRQIPRVGGGWREPTPTGLS